SLYRSLEGTSMATAHVSGVAALLYAKGARTPSEVEKALFDGASPVNGQEWSDEYGHGLLNAEQSLNLLRPDRSHPSWSPLFPAGGLLILVLLTLRPRRRPGYLNILLSPAFFIPLVLATVGVFFARWAFGGAKGVAAQLVDYALLPIPDWQRFLFGRGRLANPLFYSALIPLACSAFAIALKGLRHVVAGLAMGFAGFLLYAAWTRAPGLAYLPFTFLALPWLIANGVICLFIARAMLDKEVAR